MTQRGRPRNAGVIDASLGETVPYPIAPAWVSGRFYGGSLCAATLTTIQPGVVAFLMPIIVPQMVTVTSIGIEVATAGGAGSLMRLAIYTNRDTYPDELVIDAGTVAVDGTGYQSIVISQVLKAGPYWTACANKTVTTSAIVRAYPVGTGCMHAITMASTIAPGAANAVYCTLSTNPAAGGIVDTGWMRKFFIGDTAAFLGGASATPRVMLGV